MARFLSVAAGRIRATLLQSILPVRCFQCNQLYALPEELEESEGSFERLCAGVLCPACCAGFKPIASPLCLHCGIPFAGPDGLDHVCGECATEPPRFQKARSTGAYDGALRCLIHWLKYRGRVQLAAPLGSLLWRTFRRCWRPEEIDLIVPVPLHPRRLRQRGFNQAYQLVRKWPRLAAAEGLAWPAERIAPELLRRCRPTAPQTGLDRSQRKTNLAQAIELSGGANIGGRKVLLIDDVLTTGTTADQCAGVLLAAGAHSVHVLTLGRTV